jgi:hypothetical protein
MIWFLSEPCAFELYLPYGINCRREVVFTMLNTRMPAGFDKIPVQGNSYEYLV